MFGAEGPYLHPGDVEFNSNLRWSNSFRHFNASVEQKQRNTLGSNVSNRQRLLDLGGTYQENKQDSLSLSIPIEIYGAWGLKLPSPTATTPGGAQATQEARGLGDISLVYHRWIADVDRYKRGNVQLGFGIQAPTGNDDVTSLFPDRTGKNFMQRPADWSIQPGTGGWGLVFDFQGFQRVGDMTAYGSATYVAMLEDLTNTPSILANFGGVTAATAYEKYNTIADAYLLRAGGIMPIRKANGLNLSFGLRMEGVPISNLLSGGEGFRRPGYSVFIDPGLIWERGRDTWSFYGPLAAIRRRDEDSHGNKGDATFPDYVLMFGYAHKFGK